MKITSLLLAFVVSHAAFAADPVIAVPTPAIDQSKVDTMDKTLLAKPVPHDACKADREKYCKEVKPGHGAIMQCMKEHEADLSADCKAMGNEMREKFKERGREIHEACANELDKFCKEDKGPRQKMECLKSHSSDLSPTCQSALPVKK